MNDKRAKISQASRVSYGLWCDYQYGSLFMSTRLIMILVILAGFFLIIAGVTFLLWQPPSDATGSTVAMAAHLAEHQVELAPPERDRAVLALVTAVLAWAWER